MHSQKLDHESVGDTCVAIVPIFKGLRYEDQLKVARVAQPTQLEAGTTLFSQGADLSQLFVIHKGRVKLTRTNADGHEQLVRVIGPGDFLGEWAFLKRMRAKHTAVALEDTQACVFDHSELITIFAEYPSVGLHMLVQVSERLAETEARLSAIVSAEVGQRLAAYLLGLPTMRRGNATAVVLPLTKKDIASLLDTTPETLSRQFARLESSGIIERRGNAVVLRDVDMLMSLSTEPD